MDKLVVKELIQHEMNVKNLRSELDKLLNNFACKEEIKKDYAALKNLLSENGPDGYRDASAKAAGIIHNFLSGK